MGTTLTGTTPQDTYDSLIKVTDNGPISGTLKALSDGLGNDSVLAISTASSSITAASGAIGLTLANSSGGTKVDFSVTENTGLSIDFNEGATARSLNLLSAGTSRLFISNAGNVGIGTSSPDQKLNIVGSQTTAYATSSGSEVVPLGGVNMTLQNTGTGGFTSVRFVSLDSSNAIGYLGFTNTTSSIGGAFVFGQRSGGGYAEQVRIQAGGGISFNGDTAAANALDDYEEGEWTIGISFGGASVGVTTLYNTGTYTKIGRQVTVNGRLSLTSKGSSTGNAAITGLPFTQINNESYRTTPCLRFANISFANAFQGLAALGTTTINLEEITEAGADGDLTNADFVNTSDIIISYTYFV